MAQPEHALQVKINQWVRECVPMPHFFCGIDRSKKQSALQHVREKARGLVAGTPDTILIVPGLPLMAVELKAPGRKPTEAQYQVGEAIIRSGHHWDFADSVAGYMALLAGWGVALPPSAALNAEHKDAVLRSAAIRREESKTGKPSRARTRAAKPTMAQVARGNRMAMVRP